MTDRRTQRLTITRDWIDDVISGPVHMAFGRVTVDSSDWRDAAGSSDASTEALVWSHGGYATACGKRGHGIAKFNGTLEEVTCVACRTGAIAGCILAYYTADVVQHRGDGTEGNTERHGYVDPEWSKTLLHEKREDVSMVVDCGVRDDDMPETVREAIEGLGFSQDNGDGRFYGQNETCDEEGASWTYALHFKRVYLEPAGWTEKPWHPKTDGGVDLSGLRFA